MLSTSLLLRRGNVNNETLRVMKITAFLLTLISLHAAAGGHSQTITISAKNAPLEEIFTEIQKQTGDEFVYPRELLRNTPSVDIEVKNATLEQVLVICFKDQTSTCVIIQKNTAVKLNIEWDLFFLVVVIPVRSNRYPKRNKKKEKAFRLIKKTFLK